MGADRGLSQHLGLNWGPFAHDVGPIVGVAILMEVVMAFFLEAGFLGLLIYGDGRIGKRMMMFSTCMPPPPRSTTPSPPSRPGSTPPSSAAP